MKNINYLSPDSWILDLGVNTLLCTSNVGAEGDTVDYTSELIYNEME